MVWQRRNLAGGDGMSNYPSEAPLFQQRGLLLVVPVFRKKQPATAKGDVEAGGQGEAGERAEEAGYDSTLHGYGHPGRCRGPKQHSGMDTRQRPTGIPHIRSPCWRSHSRPVCFARSRPLHPKPQPTTRTTLVPSRKRARYRCSYAHGYRQTRRQGVRPTNWYRPTWSTKGGTRWRN